MSYLFYRAFEERHRGSRELIKRRLMAYFPFVEPLLEHYPAAATVDLGCGRGEWLEVLTGLGFKPVGVDLDAGMLGACHELGLAVEQSDAIAYLAALPDESQVVVSAFHVVEHITFDQLQILTAEALRVLKPGGLLIMETPNPENILVATRNFYLDPTHQRPIPPELLSFVPEYYDFKRVKTIRLQERKELAQCETPSLQDVFEGASPDYAVVAQKDADPRVTASTAMAFNQEFGLAFETLSTRYDNATQLKIQKAETIARQAETVARQAETKAHQAEIIAQHADRIAWHAEIKAQQAEALGQQSFAQTQALLNSTSWRATAPLRSVSRAFRRLVAAIRERRLVSGIKRRLRTVIRW
jgi:O-antigen chain-terminating methyltransferase